MTALEIVSWIVLAFWVALSLDRSRAWPFSMKLPIETGPRSAHEVAVVVPARNESALLGETLPRLLAQEEVAVVVLVDDASDDGTAEVARRAALEGGWTDRLRVVSATPTPAGWAGKVHAMACGVEALSEDDPDWFLFTDADIAHRPGSVGALLACARENRLDLVSIMARLRASSTWERVVVPTFVFFFQLLYPFRQVASGRTAAAAGGCMLIRPEALARAGGLESIAGAVIDDVALAKSVARAGGRLWLGLDEGIRSLRAYPKLEELWRMVARSAYDQLGYRLTLLVGVVIGLAVFFVGPALLMVYSVFALFEATAGAVRILLAAVGALLIQYRLLLPAVRHHGLAPYWAKVLPLSSLLFGAMTLSSAWAHYTGRGVSWRGRKAGSA